MHVVAAMTLLHSMERPVAMVYQIKAMHKWVEVIRHQAYRQAMLCRFSQRFPKRRDRRIHIVDQWAPLVLITYQAHHKTQWPLAKCWMLRTPKSTIATVTTINWCPRCKPRSSTQSVYRGKDSSTTMGSTSKLCRQVQSRVATPNTEARTIIAHHLWTLQVIWVSTIIINTMPVALQDITALWTQPIWVAMFIPKKILLPQQAIRQSWRPTPSTAKCSISRRPIIKCFLMVAPTDR